MRLSVSRLLARVFACAIALAGAMACGADPSTPCAAGDFRYCACEGGHVGYAQCAGDGSGYGACDCSGAIPPGAGVLVDAAVSDAEREGAAPGEGDAGGPGLAGFLEPCQSDGDCASHLCFPFNAYGPHCSIPCTKDGDCPAPSPGCSNKGACKLH